MSVTTFTTVNGRILRQNKDGVVHNFVSDPLGSVVMVRDTSGNTVYEAEYDPYGNVQSESGTNPSSLGYVGSLGYIKDSATSMYVRARYLLNNLGRWLTKDLFWPSEPGYVYGNAAPNGYVDPSGKTPWCWWIEKDNWLKNPWHEWDRDCAGNHHNNIDQGFSHARRALGKMCGGSRGSGVNDRYRKCLERNGLSPDQAQRTANCLCSIYTGDHPVMLYCRPNHLYWRSKDPEKRGINAEPGRPCRISFIPGFWEEKGIIPDADTIGRAILHEMGHCCGGTHNKPPGKGHFDNDHHDNCMNEAIGWGWILR